MEIISANVLRTSVSLFDFKVFGFTVLGLTVLGFQGSWFKVKGSGGSGGVKVLRIRVRVEDWHPAPSCGIATSCYWQSSRLKQHLSRAEILRFRV